MKMKKQMFEILVILKCFFVIVIVTQNGIE